MKQKKQTIEDLMHSCVLYFERQSFSQPRIDRYKSMWKSGIVPFMAEKSIRHYDASVGEEFCVFADICFKKGLKDSDEAMLII